LNKKERLESIEAILDNLITLNKDKPIIVEGEADIKALRSLGVEGEILHINVGKNLFNLCEEISRKYNEIIILTDWDRKGGHLARVLMENFKANDMKYNTDIRAKLVYHCKKDIKDVEGLGRFIKRLRNEVSV
jgi:5S rRNA maturation endonuclease (ribonuclease M5)